VCDAMRPDVLSCYGGDTATPAIDRLADRGVLFEQAYAAGPGSSISHAALFSGQYPSSNGVIGQVSIPDSIPLIASHLRKNGYETFGIPGPARTRAEMGYGRGFDEYFQSWELPKIEYLPLSISIDDIELMLQNPNIISCIMKEYVRKNLHGPDEFTSLKIDYLRKINKKLDSPFFVFANFTSAHGAYNPPIPYKRELSGINPPQFAFLKCLQKSKPDIERSSVRQNRIQQAQDGRGDPKFFADDEWLTESELDVLRELYRGEVRYLNDQLERFFHFLESSGLKENTIVILTADHGEHFGEHGLLKHMHSHFEPCLHVPLIISGPRTPSGTRRSDFVSLIDIFDTVCDLTGLESSDETDGVSMFNSAERAATFAENGIREIGDSYDEWMSNYQFEYFQRGRKSVRTRDFLYIIDSSGEEELYSLPSETRIEEPSNEILQQHRKMITDEMGLDFNKENKTETHDPNVERNLRHLGYIK
jgi:arylsulfatase A-like enzyme